MYDIELFESCLIQLIRFKEVAKLNSILDNSALDDFIISAEMDQSEVEVVKITNNEAYLAEPTTKVFQSMK